MFVVGVWFHSAADTSLVQLLVAGGGDDFLVIEVVDHHGGLAVVGETLHERGVAVLAGVGAPHVGVDREVAHWQVRLGHHALGLYFFYRHIRLVYRLKHALADGAHYAFISISRLPRVISTAPAITFTLTFSCRNTKARMMVMTTLSLSIGATRETSPSWMALK